MHEMRHRCATDLQLRFLKSRLPGCTENQVRGLPFVRTCFSTQGGGPSIFRSEVPSHNRTACDLTLFTVQGWGWSSGCVGPCSPLW